MSKSEKVIEMDKIPKKKDKNDQQEYNQVSLNDEDGDIENNPETTEDTVEENGEENADEEVDGIETKPAT